MTNFRILISLLIRADAKLQNNVILCHDLGQHLLGGKVNNSKREKLICDNYCNTYYL